MQLDWSWLGEVGVAGGAVLVVLLALVLGLLVPRWSFRRVIEVKDQMIELERRRGDEYKSTMLVQQEVIQRVTDQRDRLLLRVESGAATLENIERRAGEGSTLSLPAAATDAPPDGRGTT